MRFFVRKGTGCRTFEVRVDRDNPDMTIQGIKELLHEREGIEPELVDLVVGGHKFSEYEMSKRVADEPRIRDETYVYYFYKPFETIKCKFHNRKALEENPLCSPVTIPYTRIPKTDGPEHFEEKITAIIPLQDIHSISTENWDHSIEDIINDYGLNQIIYDNAWCEQLETQNIGGGNKRRVKKELLHIVKNSLESKPQKTFLLGTSYGFVPEDEEIDIRIAKIIETKEIRIAASNFQLFYNELSIELKKGKRSSSYYLPTDVWRYIRKFTVPINRIEFTFRIPKDYPFRSFAVNITDGDMKGSLHLLYFVSCMVGDNWKPSTSMVTILNLMNTIIE